METLEKNMHLLVIDDEVEITKSIYRQFRRKYTVHTASSGSDALELMHKHPIQVVISDQRMPGMTGVDFFSKIKTDYPDTLKLILTGYSDIEAVIDAINEGQVFRYLTKPWNQLELEMAVKEAFEKHSLIADNKRLIHALQEANNSLEMKVKQRTNELVQVNDRLKKINLEKNKYIGIVAHDLRNPISNAYSFSGLLISSYGEFTEQEQKKFLSIINKRCFYSLNLIEEFLDSAKIEAGIMDLHFKQCNLIEIIQECILQHEPLALKKLQKIVFEAQQQEVVTLCDESKMEQVFNNLISNAIKYSEKGKRIFIEVSMDKHKAIVSIKDEGLGIKESDLESLFHAFHTTSNKSTGGEKSTGLGLAIVKKIIDAHQGSIQVKSVPEKGSEFVVRIPLSHK